MDIMTSASAAAPQDSLYPAATTSPEPRDPLRGLASSVAESVRCIGAIVAYLAGSYGDDRRSAGSDD